MHVQGLGTNVFMYLIVALIFALLRIILINMETDFQRNFSSHLRKGFAEKLRAQHEPLLGLVEY